jgi:hypothetical protein
MAAGQPKVILVLCADRTIQTSLRKVVEEAGCRASVCETVATAQRTLERTTAVLILSDPLLAAAAKVALAASCPIVEFSVRTSSTGVRRMAKRNDASVKWLTGLVESHCVTKPDR